MLPWRCVSRPVGGTPALPPPPVALIPPSPRFLSSPSPFSVFGLCVFCSVTLSLLTLPLSRARTNALSHHCFSLLSLSPSHPLSSSYATISLLVDTCFLSFTPSFFSAPHAHFCCLSATSFCSGFLADSCTIHLFSSLHMT